VSDGIFEWRFAETPSKQFSFSRRHNFGAISKEGASITSQVASQNPTHAPSRWHSAMDNFTGYMQYKPLGNTGLLVSRLCLGTMTFGESVGIYKPIAGVDQKGADELIKASIDAGLNFFDTADVYSAGKSEKILGQSLKNLNIARKDVVLATKFYNRMGPGRNDVGASRGHIMDAIEASLRRLQTDHIDLYQIHANDFVTPIEETLRALDTLVTQGKVRYIGVFKLAGVEDCKSTRHL
jgi:aryl-alcohol dehydrogenase-like predicted oxidoreductase